MTQQFTIHRLGLAKCHETSYVNCMLKHAEILKMSATERLQAMEQLWDTLNREPQRTPSPDWHKDVLHDREGRAERGEAKFLTLQQLRNRLHDRKT